MSPPLAGLYAITSDALCADADRLHAAVELALRGGAALIQYRDKTHAPAERRQRSALLAGLCREHGRMLIINDDVDLALHSGAAGVHLGAGDLPVAQARRHLGPAAIIGASCGASLARAVAAQDAGASYVAFGRFFPSATKPEAPAAPLSILTEARLQLRLPLCAIGGITPANAGQVIGAGASLVAAVEGVFGAADIEAAARAYERIFHSRRAL